MSKAALQVLTLEQAENWNQIIRSFSLHDVYYLSTYVKAFQIHGDGEPLLFYYDDGKNKGINVVMKRSISEDPYFNGILDENRYFDLATPYGYGGWLIIGNSEQIFKDYERWCMKNNIVSEFVRFHPMLGNEAMVSNHYEVIPGGETVAMDLRSPEIIWDNINSKNRNVIRKAIKNDVKIYNGRFPEIYKIFRTIYNSTMDKDEAQRYYYFGERFYESILEDLSENAQIFWAEKDGLVIAASIMLECNGFMNYHLSGSLREYSSLAPTNLLLYHAALWGNIHGMRTLFLGGGVGSEEDNLFKFKRSFYKDELRRFFIGRKVFDTDVYQELTMIRADNIKNKNYFPVYRG